MNGGQPNGTAKFFLLDFFFLKQKQEYTQLVYSRSRNRIIYIVGQLLNQSINQSINQPVNQSIIQYINM